MRRKIAVGMMIMAVGLLSTASLLAEGVQEGSEESARDPRTLAYEQFESIGVEGTIELSADRPELTTKEGEVYRLMYPYSLAEDIEVETGDRISVEGFVVPGPRWEWDEGEKYLKVESVILNGEEYEPASRFGPGYGRHGMRGGYGPGMRGHMGPTRGGTGWQGNPSYQGGPQSRW